MSASTYGNYTYGNASTTTNLHLNCNSYDTTVNWQHVLNACSLKHLTAMRTSLRVIEPGAGRSVCRFEQETYSTLVKPVREWPFKR